MPLAKQIISNKTLTTKSISKFYAQIKSNKAIIWPVKLLIGCLAYIYILPKIANLQDEIASQNITFTTSSYLSAGLAIMLTPINWFIETIKWKFLISRFHPINLKTASKAIIQGIVLSIITPNRIGEVIGRSISIKGHKTHAASASILSSTAQSSVTFISGAFAIHIIPEIESSPLNISISLIIATTILTLYLILPKIVYKLPFQNNKYISLFSNLKHYNTKDLIIAFLLSTFRYLIFCSQFILFCTAFSISSTITELFIAVSATFFITTAIPTNFLSELGVRGSASYFIFSSITATPMLATIASWSLWLTNLGIPALTGAIILLFWGKQKD